MDLIRHFVPGQRKADLPVLTQWRQGLPAGVVRAYVEACTKPGDLVLLPFCQGPDAVREATYARPHDLAAAAGGVGDERSRPHEAAPGAEPAEGRRVVALHYDPCLLLPTQVALSGLHRRDLDAAVARLGDSPKAGVPLRHHLNDLYTTACPACGMPVPASTFVWHREEERPLVRELSCSDCGWEGKTTATLEDQAMAVSMPVPELTRHYLLERVAPRDGEIRSRLEYLLGLYPLRTQYALATLTRKITERGAAERDMGLRLLLLDCLERCHSLHPAGAPPDARRPSSFRRPARFVERNVWRAFEDAAERVGACLQPEASPPLARLPGAVDPGSAYLGVGQVRSLPDSLPEASAGLILLAPPRLDPVAWSLTALWTAWIFGAESAAPLWPLLQRRSADTVWYARVLSASLRTLRSLLAPGARLILAVDDVPTTLLETLLDATTQAGLRTAAVLQAGRAYRIELDGEPLPAPAVPLRDAAVQAAQTAIQRAGEPLGWEPLHAAVYGHLSQTGQLRRRPPEGAALVMEWIADEVDGALGEAQFVRLSEDGGPRWWLQDLDATGESLADRTEAAAMASLEETLAAPWHTLLAAIYARLPGLPAPEPDMVEACLQSYARPVAGDLWQIRPEDLPGARAAEREGLRSDLRRLGQRFGYASTPAPPGYDVAWMRGDRCVALFRVQADARLSHVVNLPPADGPHYLVLPGGRSALVSFKLARNPVLRQKLEEGDWHFIKTRHVRQLAARKDVERFGLQTIIGLDPIVEREDAQIPMF